MKRLLASFGHGFRGIAATFRTERNFRIHCALSIVAIALGFFFRLSPTEWIAVSIVIGMVMAAEAMNTGLEALADATHPERDPLIGKAKDAGAAAVLLTSIAAIAVGLIVFAPKLWKWLSQVLET